MNVCLSAKNNLEKILHTSFHQKTRKEVFLTHEQLCLSGTTIRNGEKSLLESEMKRKMERKTTLVSYNSYYHLKSKSKYKNHCCNMNILAYQLIILETWLKNNTKQCCWVCMLVGRHLSNYYPYLGKKLPGTLKN